MSQVPVAHRQPTCGAPGGVPQITYLWSLTCGPRARLTSRKTAISGAPKSAICGAWAVCHRYLATKIYFCGARAHAPQKYPDSVAHQKACATEILSVAHVPSMRHRIACATEKNMRHRIIYRYSRFADAYCINTGILQEIQVYIQDLYRYNRNNNIVDTVYENIHITMSSHYLEPEIHTYSDKLQILHKSIQ